MLNKEIDPSGTQKKQAKKNKPNPNPNQNLKYNISDIFFANSSPAEIKDQPVAKIGHSIDGFINSPMLGLALFQHFGQYMRNIENIHLVNKKELTDELRAEYIKAFFEKMRLSANTLWSN